MTAFPNDNVFSTAKRLLSSSAKRKNVDDKIKTNKQISVNYRNNVDFLTSSNLTLF